MTNNHNYKRLEDVTRAMLNGQVFYKGKYNKHYFCKITQTFVTETFESMDGFSCCFKGWEDWQIKPSECCLPLDKIRGFDDKGERVMDKNHFAEFSQELDKMSGEDILKGIYKELKKEHKQIAVNAIREMVKKVKHISLLGGFVALRLDHILEYADEQEKDDG
ncbi:MAG: hypothetical protein GY928_05395 [Colwellia sp.]|nr:hypothetical protein [Colwellia sp.]